jgi:hypothetical protein
LDFFSFVRTPKRIPDKVQKLTGTLPLSHRDSQLKKAPNYAHVLNQRSAWLAGEKSKFGEDHARFPVVLCGHNILRFDLPLAFHQAWRDGIDLYRTWMSDYCFVLDSLYMAKDKSVVWPFDLLLTKTGKPSYALGSVYSACFQGPIENAHNALGDVQALARALQKKDGPFSSIELCTVMVTFDTCVLNILLKSKVLQPIIGSLCALAPAPQQQKKKKKKTDNHAKDLPGKTAVQRKSLVLCSECKLKLHRKDSTCSMSPHRPIPLR